MKNSMVKISQNIKQTIAGILFVSGAITIPVAATASTAEALSEMITATPSARVVVTIEDGVATLSGIVPEASTRDSLLHAASEIDNVSFVNDELLVAEQRSTDSYRSGVASTDFLLEPESSSFGNFNSSGDLRASGAFSDPNASGDTSIDNEPRYFDGFNNFNEFNYFKYANGFNDFSKN